MYNASRVRNSSRSRSYLALSIIAGNTRIVSCAQRIVLVVLASILGLAVHATAEDPIIRIRDRDSSYEKRFAVPSSVPLVLTVHLQGAGDPVDGFRVVLVRDRDMQAVTQISNEHGLAVFKDLGPGDYTAVLRPTREQWNSSLVSIADFTLAYENIRKPEQENE